MALSHQYGAAAQKSASDMAAELQGVAVVKVAGDKPSGKAKKALDRIEQIQSEKLEPKEPFRKKRKVASIRLQEEVEEAFKSNGGSISDVANSLLTEYALKQGWL